MTLLEMSRVYQSSAAAICRRITDLRSLAKVQTDPDEVFRLCRRINELTPLLREARELAALTEHYYDRSSHHEPHYL